MTNANGKPVAVWSRVKFQDMETREIVSYTLVPPEAADPSAGRISIGCPLAAGLLAGWEGATLRIQLPEALKTYKILSVEEARPGA